LKTALNHPRGLAIDDKGRVYIADTYNNVIRLFDPSTGTITTVAGIGSPGYGDGVAATSAALRAPAAVALDGQGSLYIADTANQVVRQLGTDGMLHTVAGTPGKAGESGDNGPAILAQLSSPMGLAVRPDGDLLIADSGNNVVRLLSGSLGAGPTPPDPCPGGRRDPELRWRQKATGPGAVCRTRGGALHPGDARTRECGGVPGDGHALRPRYVQPCPPLVPDRG